MFRNSTYSIMGKFKSAPLPCCTEQTFTPSLLQARIVATSFVLQNAGVRNADAPHSFILFSITSPARIHFGNMRQMNCFNQGTVTVEKLMFRYSNHLVNSNLDLNPCKKFSRAAVAIPNFTSSALRRSEERRVGK